MSSVYLVNVKASSALGVISTVVVAGMPFVSNVQMQPADFALAQTSVV